MNRTYEELKPAIEYLSKKQIEKTDKAIESYVKQNDRYMWFMIGMMFGGFISCMVVYFLKN